MSTLTEIPQLFSDSPEIVILTMEIFSRYAQYFENHEVQFEVIIKTFTSERYFSILNLLEECLQMIKE